MKVISMKKQTYLGDDIIDYKKTHYVENENYVTWSEIKGPMKSKLSCLLMLI